ncbi:MAG: TPM domain-containing protein [Nitrospira sp.]|nr:TPM domain-containing protein [Nitrospira sp.]
MRTVWFSHRLLPLTGFVLAMSLMTAGTGYGQSPYYEHLKERIPLPGPLGYVSDHAQVLDREWKERIRSVCQDLERKTGVEMVVVTVPTINPFPSANEYATRLYEKWNIGSTQQEHGIMLLVAVGERQAAIALGRRMIPIITPEVRYEVGHRYLFPAIERGEFGEGLYQTVVALASPAQEVRVGDLPHTHMKGLGFWLTVLLSAVAVSTFWFISRPDLRHPYRRLQKGEYWGTGQGGFGGNWGGFGGGTSGEGWR